MPALDCVGERRCRLGEGDRTGHAHRLRRTDAELTGQHRRRRSGRGVGVQGVAQHAHQRLRKGQALQGGSRVGEPRGAGQREDRDGGQRVDIGGRPRCPAGQDRRIDETGRAMRRSPGVTHQSGRAQVGKQGPAITVEQQVAGRDVTVDQADLVRRRQSTRDRRQQAAELSGRAGALPPHQSGEAATVGVVEDQHRPTQRAEDPVQPQDVRMLEPGQQRSLAPQPVVLSRVTPGPQPFERHDLPGHRGPGAPHLAAGPETEQLLRDVPRHLPCHRSTVARSGHTARRSSTAPGPSTAHVVRQDQRP